METEFTATELHRVGRNVDGHILTETDTLWIASGSFPMGHTWSLFYAQRTNEHLFGQSLGVQRQLVRDGDAPMCIRIPSSSSAHIPSACSYRTHYYAYVDNLGIMSTDREEVLDGLQYAIDHFTKHNLTLQETSIGTGARDLLGTITHAFLHRTTLTTARFWNTRMAIS